MAERADQWSWDDTRIAVHAWARQMQGKANRAYIKKLKAENRYDPKKHGHLHTSLSGPEKAACIASLEYRGPKGERRKIGALNYKLSNLSSCFFYIMRFGTKALAERLQARRDGEEEVYVGTQRLTRGCSHGSTGDMEVMLTAIEEGIISAATMLTSMPAANSHGPTEAPGAPNYRDVITQLVRAGDNLVAYLGKNYSAVDTVDMVAALDAGATILANTGTAP